MPPGLAQPGLLDKLLSLLLPLRHVAATLSILIFIWRVG
jgi:hypothetical protein